MWAFDWYFPDSTMVSNLSLHFHQWEEKQKSAVITPTPKAL